MLILKVTIRHILLRYFAPELRAWYGLLPLWIVFWGYGVLASAILITLYVIALGEHQRDVQQALLILFALYTLWILVSVWRCSENSGPHLRLLSRCLTISWAVNAVMVMLFLELDLIVSWFE